MPRHLRIEYPEALYHVTTRGSQQGAIFRDDHDRASFLAILARTLKACDACAFAYCLMGNHYHVVLQTHQANLSMLVRRVNSLHSLTFNRRHGCRGHVFDGRYKALHVDRDAYLLEVCRYVDLNPVRAGLVESPAQWAWSSYRAHTGSVPPPAWLSTTQLHASLTGSLGHGVTQAELACRSYADWVRAGRGVQLWRTGLLHGQYLGGEAFAARVEGLRR